MITESNDDDDDDAKRVCGYHLQKTKNPMGNNYAKKKNKKILFTMNLQKRKVQLSYFQNIFSRYTTTRIEYILKSSHHFQEVLKIIIIIMEMRLSS